MTTIQKTKTNTKAGTLSHWAPESIRPRRGAEILAGDMWGVGVMAYQMVYGKYLCVYFFLFCFLLFFVCVCVSVSNEKDKRKMFVRNSLFFVVVIFVRSLFFFVLQDSMFRKTRGKKNKKTKHRKT